MMPSWITSFCSRSCRKIDATIEQKRLEYKNRAGSGLSTHAEWLHMGGEGNSDYKRAYKMITEGYSMKDTAKELRLQTPNITEKQLQKILLRAGELWINNNRNKLLWAYNSRRRYIRFSQDPAVMLLQVLVLLVGAAVKAILRDIEERHTERQIDSSAKNLKRWRHTQRRMLCVAA